MSVIWNNLSFVTDVNGIVKLVSAASCGCCFRYSNVDILQKLFGSVQRGELVALLGPSGAGKSTLLNCITQGKHWKGCDGAIYVAGLVEPARASFINQNESEHLLISLTVAQSLNYASLLKNPPNTPRGIHEEIVKNLIDDLDLKACENTDVKKLSGGQKKRLAIGLELTALKKPQFLFLDEPTSGLDSYVGLKVVQLLSTLSKLHNMAIVTTIHQPSYKMFVQFSKAFILTGRGEFIYAGEPQQLKSALESSGYKFEPGSNENPADVAIELASAMKRPVVMESKKNKITYSRNNPNVYLDLTDELTLESGEIGSVGETADVNYSEKPDAEHDLICQSMTNAIRGSYVDFLSQNLTIDTYNIIRHEDGLCRNGSKFNFHSLWTLFLRSAHTSILKQKQFILIRLILHAIVAIVLASLYSRTVGFDDSCVQLISPELAPNTCSCAITAESLRGSGKSSASSNVKFHFFSLLFLMFASLMPTVLTFPSEIKLFLNEHRNGWYTTFTYYVAKTITEIPFQILFPTIYVYFLYWYSGQVGMEEWYKGLVGFMSDTYRDFLFVTIMCCFIAQGLGFLIGILCVRSFNISIIVSSSVLLFIFLFSGFFVKRAEMGESVSWITYFSFIRFGFETILLIIYGNNRCSEPYVSSVHEIFSIHDHDFKFNVWMLVGHLVLSRLLAFLALEYMANPKFLKCDIKILNPCYNYVQNKATHMRRLMRRSTIRVVWACLVFVGIQVIVLIGVGVYFVLRQLV